MGTAYLYDYDGTCGIRRITISTGATSQVTIGVNGPITLGPDGYLYAVDSSRNVLKIDPGTESSTTIYTLDTTEGGNAITSDDTYLWVSVTINVSYPCGNETPDIALFTTTLPFAVLLSLIAAPPTNLGQRRSCSTKPPSHLSYRASVSEQEVGCGDLPPHPTQIREAVPLEA